MKILVCYPPIKTTRKFPLLGQNRQFRYSSSSGVRIYPIVPSSTATLLNNAGFKVKYLDAINLRLSWTQFIKEFNVFSPDIVIIEVKTPVIYYYWNVINSIKKNFPDIQFVLVGDHVSFRPDESLKKSRADFVATGGDYDVEVYKLVKYLNGEINDMPAGIWYKKEEKLKNTGLPQLVSNLDEVPFIDRELTNWKIYGEAYLNRPCTYTMWGRGCAPGICTFCVWSSNLWNNKARLRSVDNVLDEIEILVNTLKIKEIFDDTDTSTWNKKWLKKLCNGLINRGLNDKVFLSCNARATNLDKETCKLMKKAGFRLLKVGLESGCNKTLKKIKKIETIEQIKQGIKNAKDHGLNVLMTMMVGYPWESKADFNKTYQVAKELMLYKTKVGDSLQASVVIPYPGTPLYLEAIKEGWFRIDPNKYDDYDMSQPVLNAKISPEEINEFCDRLWKIHLDIKFILKTLLGIRRLGDFRLIWQGIRSVFGHTNDF